MRESQLCLHLVVSGKQLHNGDSAFVVETEWLNLCMKWFNAALKVVYLKSLSQGKKVVPCRFDWHQTGAQVIISIYAKNAVPELSYVDANSTTVSDSIVCQMISVHF